MGTVSKRGDKFLARARVTKNFINQSKSKTFNTQTEAWAWVERTEKEMRYGVQEEIDHTKKLKDAIIRYRDEVSPTKKGAHWEIISLNAFLKQDYLPINVPLMKLSSKHIPRNKREVSNSSKNREIALLRVIFEKCID